MLIGNGQNTRFWEDTWLGDKPLSDQYPTLYNIVHHKHVTIANVMNSTPLNIGFRRTLLGNKWQRWLHLVSLLVELNEEEDVF